MVEQRYIQLIQNVYHLQVYDNILKCFNYLMRLDVIEGLNAMYELTKTKSITRIIEYLP
jgi:hypothetical protein